MIEAQWFPIIYVVWHILKFKNGQNSYDTLEFKLL